MKGLKLPIPVICECGFNTMDAEEALNHILVHERLEKAKKPEISIEPGMIESMADDR